MLCDQFPNVVVRGYAQREGLTWAVHLMTASSTLRLELSSAFAGGASLLTSRDRDVVDDPANRAYRQAFPDADAKTLVANHQARLAALEGTPLRTIPTAAGLAGYVEAWLVARLEAPA
jgi:hypothetical protein